MVAANQGNAAAAPRPGSAVRITPAPSPAASPQKAAAGLEFTAQGLRTPPRRPAVAAASTPLARPCSGATNSTGDPAALPADSAAAADEQQLSDGSQGPAHSGLSADSDAEAAAAAARGASERHTAAAAAGVEPDAEGSDQRQSDGEEAAAWAAAAAAAQQLKSSEGDDPDDLALSVVRDHAAALTAAASEQTESACSVM